MRGFPGFVNQKMGGTAPTPPSLPSPAMLPKAPAMAAPSLPQMPVLARPIAAVPTPPVTPVVVVPVMRPVTVATVTRNLQAALGPEAPPPAPSTQGFPGFISRNFNQVSQHQPGASNSNHLSGLASLFNQGAAATERRQARPAPVRPAPQVLARPAAAPTRPPAGPAVNSPVAVKKPEPLKAPQPARATLPASQPAAELPKPTVAVQAKTVPLKTPAAAPQPQPTDPAKAAPPPKLEAPKPAAPAKLQQEDEQKKPPVALLRSGKLGQGKPKAQTAALAPVQSNSTGFKPPAEAPKAEGKPPVLESKPAAREAEPTRPIAETKSAERVEGPSAVSKAPAATQAPPAPPVKANLEKLAQVRPENSEVKVGELQRQQVNSLQAPVSREQLALAQQSGAGLSAGGGSGQGGGGGQHGRRRRHQEGEERVEEVGSADSLGGDDQVHWWHLRGEENMRALSCELRESMFLLRTPQRPLGVDPKAVRVQKAPPRQELAGQPQVQQVREEGQRQVSGDQVQLEAADLCRSCGHQLDGLDPRRCPACLRQAALATLALLEADGRFIAYRVFLTLCRQPVASRAVYHLRDFSSLPSGAYCVQAA